MQFFKWSKHGLKFLVCATTLGACAEELADFEHDALEGQIDGGETSESDPLAREAPGADAGTPLDHEYAAVYALISEHCVSCHGAGKTLDMSSPELAHEQLVDVAAGYKACVSDGGPELIRVVPRSSSESLLMAKLENRQTCGKQMPTKALLAPAEVAAFRAWIEAGANLY